METGSRSFLTDLPNEIVFLILRPLRPTYEPDPPGPHPPHSWHTRLISSYTGYWYEMRKFASLRLTCRTMDRQVCPLLYEDLVLRLTRAIDLETIDAVLSHNAQHVRTILIDGSEERVESQIWTQASEILGRGLGLCANLRALNCQGIHCLFPTRKWSSKTFRNPPPRLMSLSIMPYHMDVSYSLQILGRQLRSLELHRWRPTRTIPLHIPNELPFLEELTISLSQPELTDLQRIMSRIGSQDRAKKTRTTPLRTLNVIDTKTDIHGLLLINNVSMHLTTLRIIGPMALGDTRQDVLEHVRKTLDVCPNLKNLCLQLERQPTSLLWVPRQLEHLRLYICTPQQWYWHSVPFAPEVETVKSVFTRKPSCLRTLFYLHWRYGRRVSLTLEQRASLLDVGVHAEEVDADPEEWVRAEGYKFSLPPPAA